jgi:alpha-beta hydrolase superfamily lysophospholipase
VPAAYSQRAVPDLEARIRWHLKRAEPGPGRRLVLCGHSQGSLLSFATLLRLAASPRQEDAGLIDEIGLVTFGSQLQVMFSRGFPAYVNRAAITHLFQQLDGAWRNLYRGTDQLAGPVLSWNHRRCPEWIGRPEGQVPAAAPPPLGPPGRQQFGPDWRLLDPPIPADPDLDENALLGLRRHGEYWLDPAWTTALQVVRSGDRESSTPTKRDRT